MPRGRNRTAAYAYQDDAAQPASAPAAAASSAASSSSSRGGGRGRGTEVPEHVKLMYLDAISEADEAKKELVAATMRKVQRRVKPGMDTTETAAAVKKELDAENEADNLIFLQLRKKLDEFSTSMHEHHHSTTKHLLQKHEDALGNARTAGSMGAEAEQAKAKAEFEPQIRELRAQIAALGEAHAAELAATVSERDEKIGELELGVPALEADRKAARLELEQLRQQMAEAAAKRASVAFDPFSNLGGLNEAVGGDAQQAANGALLASTALGGMNSLQAFMRRICATRPNMFENKNPQQVERMGGDAMAALLEGGIDGLLARFAAEKAKRERLQREFATVQKELRTAQRASFEARRSGKRGGVAGQQALVQAQNESLLWRERAELAERRCLNLEADNRHLLDSMKGKTKDLRKEHRRLQSVILEQHECLQTYSARCRELSEIINEHSRKEIADSIEAKPRIPELRQMAALTESALNSHAKGVLELAEAVDETRNAASMFFQSIGAEQQAATSRFQSIAQGGSGGLHDTTQSSGFSSVSGGDGGERALSALRDHHMASSTDSIEYGISQQQQQRATAGGESAAAETRSKKLNALRGSPPLRGGAAPRRSPSSFGGGDVPSPIPSEIRMGYAATLALGAGASALPQSQLRQSHMSAFNPNVQPFAVNRPMSTDSVRGGGGGGGGHHLLRPIPKSPAKYTGRSPLPSPVFDRSPQSTPDKDQWQELPGQSNASSQEGFAAGSTAAAALRDRAQQQQQQQQAALASPRSPEAAEAADWTLPPVGWGADA